MITYELQEVCIDDPMSDTGGYLVPPTPAYVADRRWNGWLVPYFTRENADKVMAALNANLPQANVPHDLHEVAQDGECWFDPQRDGYCVCFESREEMESYEGEDIEVDGETIHVYGIGAAAWTWDITEVAK